MLLDGTGTGLLVSISLMAVGILDYIGTATAEHIDSAARVSSTGLALTRDPALWPFSRTSPWNYPLGSNAQFAVPVAFGSPRKEPLTGLLCNERQCGGLEHSGVRVRVYGPCPQPHAGGSECARRMLGATLLPSRLPNQSLPAAYTSCGCTSRWLGRTLGAHQPGPSNSAGRIWL